MTFDQFASIGIIALSLVLFAWGRWRYDVVAVTALVACVLIGVVPADRAFSGFSDAAVVTVAAVLVISQALERSGVIGVLSASVERFSKNAALQIGVLTLTVAIFSAFMNNVGALALMLPVALRAAKASGIAPSLLLMPIAFGSLLGGLATLIGTPPNIIIASFRAEALGRSFGQGGGFQMFDFAPVGAVTAIAGVAFIAIVGYRLLPVRESKDTALDELMGIEDYVTELAVPEDSPMIGKPIREVVVLADGDVSVVALIRDGETEPAPPWYTRIHADDHLIIEGDTDSIAKAIEGTKFQLVTDREFGSDSLSSEEVALVEAVVNPGSRLDGRTPRGLRVNSRYGVNILAVARRGRSIRDRIGHIRFEAGDVLLVQGPRQVIYETLRTLGCLPLAQRDIPLVTRRNFLPLAIFAAAIAATAAGLVRIDVAFVTVVVLLVVSGLFPVRDVYESVDWPVLVLLGAFLPVGGALATTGVTELIANGVTAGLGKMPFWVLVVTLMTLSSLLSAVINNAATAVLMAPIAVGMARLLGIDFDAFLMAVAIGSSSAFLTPIGHQSNLLVMGPAGYHFGDYWRMGLPLTLVTFAVATPMIVWVWGP